MKQRYQRAALLCLTLLPVKSVMATAAIDSETLQDNALPKNPVVEKLQEKDNIWGFSSAGREMVDVTTTTGQVIKAVDVDGYAYVGDMILGKTADLKKHGLRVAGKNKDKGKDSQTSGRGTKAAMQYPSLGYAWPNGVVPYVVASNLGPNAASALNYAITNWNSNTNVKLVPRTNQSNYVVVQGANSCSSAIGMQGGVQYINLGEGCGNHGAIHEFGHALGFYHEHTRTDRDNYVEILWNNMDPNMAYNFYTLNTNEGNNHGYYDYHSIMHYPTHGFSINGGATLWPYDNNIDPAMLGHENSLSQGDIAAAATAYGTPTNNFHGYLENAGDYQIQPDGNYFEHGGGMLSGTLTAQGGTDFDLSLFMWDNGWVEVASSETWSSNEHINFSAPAGYYYFRVSSYSGSGNYTLNIR